jgi:hypothetical protein
MPFSTRDSKSRSLTNNCRTQDDIFRNLLIKYQGIVGVYGKACSGYDRVKVLIITDEPEAPAFDQIVGLRKAIQELVGKVDLLAFSKDYIFFNQKKISEKGDTNIGSAQNILAKKRYTLIIVSLGIDNLRKIFFEKSNIMQFLRNSPSRVRMYVFGASDLPDEIVTSRSVDLFPYSRQETEKSTQEFKNAILDYVRKEQGAHAERD